MLTEKFRAASRRPNSPTDDHRGHRFALPSAWKQSSSPETMLSIKAQFDNLNWSRLVLRLKNCTYKHSEVLAINVLVFRPGFGSAMTML